MAVANTKSTQITNADARTITHQNRQAGGVLYESIATVEVAAADDSASVYRFVRVPWNARISEISYASDAITGLSGDIGVYETAADGGAVVDADEFASAAVLSSAIDWTAGTNEAATTQISDCEKELWDRMGATEVKGKQYDICITATADPTAAGTLSLRVRYVV